MPKGYQREYLPDFENWWRNRNVGSASERMLYCSVKQGAFEAWVAALESLEAVATPHNNARAKCPRCGREFDLAGTSPVA
jgi:hypothetical protein